MDFRNVDYTTLTAALAGFKAGMDDGAPDREEIIAAEATALKDGNVYIAIDSGGSVRPRYDVIRAPALGDKISFGFNGDYYPDGEIVRISKTRKKITSSNGRAYYRTNERSGSWKHESTWGMVPGHRDERNPSF